MKNLAGELGLDRGLVIELLRNPSPKLLLMSDSLPDEAPSKPEIEKIEASPVADEVVVDEVAVTETDPQMDLPIHVMSNEWSAHKRLKKAQLETLERVYHKSKRPTVSNFTWRPSITFTVSLLLLENVSLSFVIYHHLYWCFIYNRIPWLAA
jgi:hypothetical protein